MDKIQQLANDLKQHKGIVFTGAGVSTNSGIPDFRSKTGFYQKYHEDDLSIDAFFRDPDKFYIAFQEKFASVFKAHPNDTHKILGMLEAEGYIDCVITQNVDQLHQAGGSKKVLEFHGNIFEYNLIQILDADLNHYRIIQNDIHINHLLQDGRIQYRVGLNTVYKPKVVLYGENVMAWKESIQAAIDHKIHIIMGTSYLVSPFNMVSYENKDPDLKVYVINNQPITYYPFNHAEVIQIIGDTSVILTELSQLLKT